MADPTLVESVAQDVFFNSVATAILTLLILPPQDGKEIDHSIAVPELLKPIRDKYGYDCVKPEEVAAAVSFLKEKGLVDGVDTARSITCSLTEFGEEVARVLFPEYFQGSETTGGGEA